MSEFVKRFGLFPPSWFAEVGINEKRFAFILLKFGIRGSESARRITAEFRAAWLRQELDNINSAALLISLINKQRKGKLIHSEDGDRLLPDWA